MHAGTNKWKIQELHAQGSGKQGDGKKVTGLFCVPQRGQSSESSGGTC